MSKPDIIFVVLDTQRADRLGTYGHQKAYTPNLDKFASQAALFEQAVSPAQWTIPSHASFFSGLYPTAHQVTQSSQSLSPDIPNLAEVLQESGYETIGFCNNPLVGILNNGFKRGFQTFYNYGGAFPSLPKNASRFPAPINNAIEAYTQFLRKISYPVQNYFGQSDLAFRLSLNSWTTPLWSRFANFKGQNARSVRDVCHFLREREKQEPDKPLFLFLNLMETHLPFWPPGEFIDKIAPYFRKSKEARQIMQIWNREAYRWAAPLEKPLGELEHRVLSDLYDAEVAYQDDYLGELFDVLNGRSAQPNTLTIIVSDHGDGLGEHGYMGHAFVAYEELVHVPLILQWPMRIPPATRIATPVSTRRVYHTILDAVGHLPDKPNLDPITIHSLTLTHTTADKDPENGTAFSEIYPPMNFVRAIENRQPHLLDPFRCLCQRRAVVKADKASSFKLIHVDEQPDELFNLAADPLELENQLHQQPSLTDSLNKEIQQMTSHVTQQQDHLAAGDEVELDDALMQQLRGLGYLD
ncbi:MAG: sulfatase [Chloroflexi bacterium]|nr:MAG: sulfatase [Chloroflexota bacterium]